MTPAEEISSLRTRVEALERLVRQSDARLLSKAAAARRLKISRNDTLEILIRSGQLRTVTVGKRVKIPAADVERLALEGFAVQAPD